MRISRFKGRAIGILIGAAAPLSLAAQSGPAMKDTVAPFVDIAIRGTDFVSATGLLYYRVTADPGTFVTVYRISPGGRVSILSGFDQPIRGTTRTAFVRETSSGYDDGSGYVVAVATRSRAGRQNLLQVSIGRFGLAGRFFSAEGALNDLIQNVVPKSGENFTVSYAAYHSSTYRYPLGFAMASYCAGSSFLSSAYADYPASYDIFDDGYRSDFNRFGDSYYARACYGDRLRVYIFDHRPIPPPTPRVPGDTSTRDSAVGRSRPTTPNPVPPIGSPRLGRLAIPNPIASGFDYRPVAPVQQEPRTPVMPIFAPTPLATPVPVSPPVERERNAPVVQQPMGQVTRPIPVERPRIEPRVQIPVQREVAPPPPPPPPPPMPRSEPKVLDEGTRPPPSGASK